MKIVMTGATSGIGKVAAAQLLSKGHELVVGVRGNGAPDTAQKLPLDLASLVSVRAFAETVQAPVDVLILNAGMQRLDVARRTQDGFELTFGVNHLAHYLLVRLLLPKLADGGRIVITTSGTHDPAEKTGVPAPRHCDAFLLADPTKDTRLGKSPRAAGMRAYSTSKLANLLTARALAALPEVQAKHIIVHAYDPGLTPATGLARSHPGFVRVIFRWVLPYASRFSAGMNSLKNAGAALAGLADGSISNSEIYMALRRGKPTWPSPSNLAMDDDVRAELWADSATLVGI